MVNVTPVIFEVLFSFSDEIIFNSIDLINFSPNWGSDGQSMLTKSGGEWELERKNWNRYLGNGRGIIRNRKAISGYFSNAHWHWLTLARRTFWNKTEAEQNKQPETSGSLAYLFACWKKEKYANAETRLKLSQFVSVFLPARRYASAGYRDRNVSVRLSVRPSVRHAPVLCQNEES